MIRKLERFLYTMCILGCQFGAGAAEPAAPKRILFIGNSYTAQVRAAIDRLRTADTYQDLTCQYIVPGGRTLTQHLAEEEVREQIKSGKWDLVVLQEQSQTPALPGADGESFQRSVDEFCTLIREAGAQPVLYMTWGRRDKDKANPELFPDYVTMQGKLSTAYRQAAERNKALLVPVGDAWARVRTADPELGQALYRGDGSHPSAAAAVLVAATFCHTLFHDRLTDFPRGKELTDAQWQVVREAILAGKPPKAGR